MQNISSTSEGHLIPLLSQYPTPRGIHYSDFYLQRCVLPVLELHVNGVIQYVLFLFNTLCLWESSILYVAIILFYWSAIFHCMNIPQCIHLAIDEHLVCFQFRVVNKATMNSLTHAFGWNTHWFLLDAWLRGGYLGHNITLEDTAQ